jgi:hypothetical protein
MLDSVSRGDHVDIGQCRRDPTACRAMGGHRVWDCSRSPAASCRYRRPTSGTCGGDETGRSEKIGAKENKAGGGEERKWERGNSGWVEEAGMETDDASASVVQCLTNGEAT